MTDIGKGTLRAYEVLKTFSDGSGSKIDALINFLRPSLSDFHGQILDVNEFSAAVNEQLHLSVTADTIEDILPLLEKKGWLKNQSNSTHSKIYVVECPANAIPDAKDDAIKAILPKFREFLGSFELPDSFDESDENLFDIISEFIISVENVDDMTSLFEDVHLADHADQMNYLCARFVQGLYEAGDESVKVVEDIAQIALISDLLREFSKPTSSVKNTKVQIFLDSPLILELLGASGKLSRDNIKTLLETARAKGAQIHAFEISIQEACNSLKSMLQQPIYDRYGPTHDAMLRKEVEEPYVRAIIENCGAILREEFKVKIDSKVSQNSFFGYQEFDKLKNDLHNIYAHQNGSMFRATHDAQAVSSIMRLRTDQYATNDLWDSGFFFLTRNRKFKDTARAFCEANRAYGGSGDFMLERDEAGPVVDIREFSSSVWLRFGSGQDDPLPRLHLLAGCERILRFNRKTLNKVRTHVNSLSLHADENKDRIDQVRIMLMNPVGVMSIQDALRGSDRQANYKTMLDAQQAAEKERIAKGVEKGSAVIRAELEDASAENQSLKDAVEEGNRRDLKAQEELAELRRKEIVEHNKDIDERWEILRRLISELFSGVPQHNNRVSNRHLIYRLLVIVIVPLVMIIDKILGAISQDEVLVAIPFPGSEQSISISPLIASIILSIAILLPVQAYLGLSRPRVGFLDRWTREADWIESLQAKAEDLETQYLLNLDIRNADDGTITTKSIESIKSEYLEANYREVSSN
ncbi:hypothetical protein [Erythrobacter aureus]|uniref:hypothetical protein n=1 Tax=Erythrobacter aureus TaxID=2182384 RepID=UPI003A8D19AB